MSRMDDVWRLLYSYDTELIISGHDHIYERFARLNGNGQPDPTAGIRSFIVGTGGRNHTAVETIHPYSKVRNDETYGVLKLTLHPHSYKWDFIAEPGATFTDTGETACH